MQKKETNTQAFKVSNFEIGLSQTYNLSRQRTISIHSRKKNEETLNAFAAKRNCHFIKADFDFFINANCDSRLIEKQCIDIHSHKMYTCIK
jgi:hypothetical protein